MRSDYEQAILDGWLSLADLRKHEEAIRLDERARIVRWLKHGEINGGTRMDAEGFAREIETGQHLRPILCAECEKPMCDGDEAYGGSGIMHASCARAFYREGCVQETFVWGEK